MSNENKRMVSRSLRLKTDTLDELKRLADIHNMGITVFIRYVLEQYVDTERLLKNLAETEKDSHV